MLRPHGPTASRTWRAVKVHGAFQWALITQLSRKIETLQCWRALLLSGGGRLALL